MFLFNHPINKLMTITFLLKRMNWLSMARVYKYCEKAQPKSAQTDRLRLE